MIVSRSIVLGGSVLLVVFVGVRLRPRATPRARASTAVTRTRRWSWVPVAAIAALASIPLSLAFVIIPALFRRWSAIQRRARTTHNISAGFPEALDLLVLSIRAGYLPAQAIGEITPYLPVALRPSFSAVDQALQRGDRFADALGGLCVQLGSIAQPLVDSLAAADRYGLPLAPVLERLSLEARQQRRRDTDAAARELPVRLALPLVLCTLPSFVLLAIVPLLLGALSSLHI
ncbi:MAG: type II secretion system F family protein [Ilumatobacteraceae bacterium]|nr:type II secretion system F family protein [Ilumatobacteraceae bacterium]